MLRQQFINFLVQEGWVEDRWGHYGKTVNSRKWRFKIQKLSFRREVWNTTVKQWVRIPYAVEHGSDYYRLFTVQEGRLKLK